MSMHVLREHREGSLVSSQDTESFANIRSIICNKSTNPSRSPSQPSSLRTAPELWALVEQPASRSPKNRLHEFCVESNSRPSRHLLDHSNGSICRFVESSQLSELLQQNPPCSRCLANLYTRNLAAKWAGGFWMDDIFYCPY